MRLREAVRSGGAERERARGERRDGACWPHPRASHQIIESGREDAAYAIDCVV